MSTPPTFKIDGPWWLEFPVLLLPLAVGLLTARQGGRGKQGGNLPAESGFDVAKSWGTTLSLAGTFVGTLISASGVFGGSAPASGESVPPRLTMERASYVTLTIVFGTLAALASTVYSIALDGKDPATHPRRAWWGFVIANTFTLGAVLGQVLILALVLWDLQRNLQWGPGRGVLGVPWGFFEGAFAVCFLLGGSVTVIWYAASMMRATLDTPPQPNQVPPALSALRLSLRALQGEIAHMAGAAPSAALQAVHASIQGLQASLEAMEAARPPRRWALL